jgi:hypothetical protein
MACAIAVIFLPAVPPCSTPAVFAGVGVRSVHAQTEAVYEWMHQSE